MRAAREPRPAARRAQRRASSGARLRGARTSTGPQPVRRAGRRGDRQGRASTRPSAPTSRKLLELGPHEDAVRRVGEPRAAHADHVDPRRGGRVTAHRRRRSSGSSCSTSSTASRGGSRRWSRRCFVAARMEEDAQPADSCAASTSAALIRLAALDSHVAGRSVELELPEHCRCGPSPRRVRRIVGNLIENAHKYGEAPIRDHGAGRPTTRWCSRSSTAAPAIPPEERERVFERFYRVDPNGTKPGHGSRALDRARARRVVRWHGVGRGRARRRRRVPGLAAHRARSRNARRWCMSERPKVLIVDDEPDVLLTLRMILEAEGFDPAARRRRRDRAAAHRRGAPRPRRARHHDAGARRLVRARRARRAGPGVRASWCARRSRATADRNRAKELSARRVRHEAVRARRPRRW